MIVPSPLINKFFDCNWKVRIALDCTNGKRMVHPRLLGSQCKFEVNFHCEDNDPFSLLCLYVVGKLQGGLVDGPNECNIKIM